MSNMISPPHLLLGPAILLPLVLAYAPVDIQQDEVSLMARDACHLMLRL